MNLDNIQGALCASAAISWMYLAYNHFPIGNTLQPLDGFAVLAWMVGILFPLIAVLSEVLE